MKKKKIDTTNGSQAYWEKILTQEGFSMDKGSLGNAQDRWALFEYLDSTNQPAPKFKPDSLAITTKLGDIPSGFEIIDEILGPVSRESLTE